MVAVRALGLDVGVVAACDALGASRASFYRHEAAPVAKPPRPRPARALSSSDERRQVRDTLNAARFADRSPSEVYATLLDEGTFYCSTRTMYRILDEHDEVRERRNQLRHPTYTKPQLLATAPNQVWSWDITKLLGPTKWSYFHLYVIIDIFSRYVVGWMVADREDSTLAQRLIRETCLKQGISPGQLIIHADRGTRMTSVRVAHLLADLGVTKTHSRPHVSDDNPYSEAQFKTLKYRPDFPDRFGSAQDARAFCQPFFTWYNQEHRHSGIALLTPAMVHFGQAQEVLAGRKVVLDAAYAAHPERFVHRPPVPAPLPEAAWINPPPRPQAPPIEAPEEAA